MEGRRNNKLDVAVYSPLTVMGEVWICPLQRRPWTRFFSLCCRKLSELRFWNGLDLLFSCLFIWIGGTDVRVSFSLTELVWAGGLTSQGMNFGFVSICDCLQGSRPLLVDVPFPSFLWSHLCASVVSSMFYICTLPFLRLYIYSAWLIAFWLRFPRRLHVPRSFALCDLCMSFKIHTWQRIQSNTSHGPAAFYVASILMALLQQTSRMTDWCVALFHNIYSKSPPITLQKNSNSVMIEASFFRFFVCFKLKVVNCGHIDV